MKIIHNGKQFSSNTYSDLSDKPSIESKELVGNVTVSDLGVYDKTQVNNLVASGRAIKIVDELPTTVAKNTLYYVGPQTTGNYNVYLVDSDGVIEFLGTSDAETYSAGYGIDIDSGNRVSIKRANNTLLFDDDNKVYVREMVGATESAAGESGLVPAPTIEDKDKVLKGDGTWGAIEIIDSLTSSEGTAALSANQGRVLNEKFGSYLPLSGGTMTGSLNMNSNAVSNLNTIMSRYDSGLTLVGYNGNYSKLTLYGGTTAAEGTFTLTASGKSSSSGKSLIGRSDGGLTWDGNNVAIGNFLPLSGGTMTGTITFSSGKKDSDYLPLSGGTMTGDIDMNSKFVTNLNLIKSKYGTPLVLTGNNSYSAQLILTGNTTSAEGYFTLKATGPSSASGISLQGSSDSTLTWGGSNVTRGLKLNGSDNPTPSFYAPTSAGTSGQFLTSTGGTPTWVSRYKHNIFIKVTSYDNMIVSFTHISERASAYTSVDDIAADLYSKGFIGATNILSATGRETDSTSTAKLIIGVYTKKAGTSPYNPLLYVLYANSDTDYTIVTSYTLYDCVTVL